MDEDVAWRPGRRRRPAGGGMAAADDEAADGAADGAEGRETGERRLDTADVATGDRLEPVQGGSEDPWVTGHRDPWASAVDVPEWLGWESQTIEGSLRRGTCGHRVAVMNHGVLGPGLGPHRMRVGLNIIGVLGYLVIGINDVGDIIMGVVLHMVEGDKMLVVMMEGANFQ